MPDAPQPMELVLRDRKTQPLRPLGSATTVLRQVRKDAKTGVAHVPCGSCTACCRSGYEIRLTASEASRFPHVPDEDGHPILPMNADGSCSMLVDNRCTVYAQRPQVCKGYDCRPFALTQMLPQQLIDCEGFVPFEVALPTRQDRALKLALMLAAIVRIQQGAQVEAAAAHALMEYKRYLPQAEQIAHVVDTNPALRAQIEAANRQLGASVQAQGGRVTVPALRFAPVGAKQTPKRLTRRRFLTAARVFSGL